MGENPSNRIAVVLLVVCLAVGLFAIHVRNAQAPPEEPVRIFYPSKGGAVVFDHAAHVDREAGDCVICHHFDGYDDEKENCRWCHEDSGIPIMHAYHEKGEDFEGVEEYQSCMSCHESNDMDPDNCRSCHK